MSLLVQIVIGLVLTVAATLIQRASVQDSTATTQGVTGRISTGGDVPMSFIVGKTATAGHFEYANTWGSVGGTPNAYFTKVVSVSDLPVRALAGFFVNGVRVTLDSSETDDLGFAVLDYRVDGVDYLWVKFYDGTQTAADPLLLDRFGSDPERPWSSDMKFTGVAYFVATARINRELFPGFPEYRAELDGISLVAGKHENPVEAIRAIMLGLAYSGDWFYGPQNVTSDHLPGWDTQSDKCAVQVALAAGGTEDTYRCGMEISVNTEPHETVGELLKACAGRMAEVGGRYRILVGQPGAAVASFTDDDIVISEGQSYEPFPGLEATYNAVTASYPEPDEAYEMKDAPPRYSSALEAEDDGRRLPFSTRYMAAPYANQVQRLMRAAVEEARRFRRHSFTAPPEWWEYEPLDVVSWTSTYNGYVTKEFLITVLEDGPDGNQLVGLQEIDPDDYDWSTDFELTYSTQALAFDRPAAQAMTGWTVAPYIFVDADGNSRRPGIEVSFAGGLDDVRAVRVQVRLAVTAATVFDGEAPYDPTVGSPSIYPQGTFLPDTEYEARGIFLPYSGRPTSWSAWLAVTTPDVRIAVADVNDALTALINRVNDRLPGDLLTLRQDIAAIAGAVNIQSASLTERMGRVRQALGARYEENAAGIESARIVAVSANSALAAMFTDLFATTAAGTATAQFRMQAASLPEGALAAIEWLLEAGSGGDFATAALRLAAFSDPELGTHTRLQIEADQFDIITPVGVRNALTFAQTDGFETAAPSGGYVEPDLRNRQSMHKTVLTGDVTLRAPLIDGVGWWYHIFEQDGAGGHSVTPDTAAYIGQPPTIAQGANVGTICLGMVLSINPPLIAITDLHSGALVAGSNRQLVVNPPVSGRFLWHLDIDGPLTVNGPGTWTIRPVGEYLDAQAELWGPGGSSGGAGGTAGTGAGSGTATTFAGMSAGPGGPSLNAANPGQTTNGGAAGTGSGGDGGTDGTPGGNAVISGDTISGSGAGAPDGGAALPGVNIGSSPDQASPGAVGNAPGGGARGAAWHPAVGASRASGGGGSGAKRSQTFGEGDLTQGNEYALVVGDSGDAGISSSAPGAKGAAGRATIT